VIYARGTEYSRSFERSLDLSTLRLSERREGSNARISSGTLHRMLRRVEKKKKKKRKKNFNPPLPVIRFPRDFAYVCVNNCRPLALDGDSVSDSIDLNVALLSALLSARFEITKRIERIALLTRTFKRGTFRLICGHSRSHPAQRRIRLPFAQKVTKRGHARVRTTSSLG